MSMSMSERFEMSCADINGFPLLAPELEERAIAAATQIKLGIMLKMMPASPMKRMGSAIMAAGVGAFGPQCDLDEWLECTSQGREG